MMEPYASIENLKQMKAYILSDKLGKLVWNIVDTWDYFAKKTIGSQWTKATDSVSANISEGYGRYFFKESIRFYYFARGSLFETYDWFVKAQERKLLTQDDIKEIQTLLRDLPIELNKLIKLTRDNAHKYKQ